MITILIFVLIGVLFSFFQKKEYYDSTFSKIVANAILFGVIGFIVALFLSLETYKVSKSFNIENLEDNNGINSQYYLGVAQVESEMRYVFYYEENNFYKMMQLKYSLVKIKYTNAKPRVIIIEKELTKSLINKFALDLDINEKEYIIEIPEGTIKKNYNLDAK